MSDLCQNCGDPLDESQNFCEKCGHRAGTDEIYENIANSGGFFEVEDSFKGSVGCLICCQIDLVVLGIMVIYMGIEQNKLQEYLPQIIGLWVFIIIALIFMRMRTIGLKGIHKFIISEEKIMVIVPKKIDFSILWSDINTIKIQKRRTGGYRSKRDFFDFFFNNDHSLHETVTIEVGIDFRRSKIRIIIHELSQRCAKLKKGFNPP